MLTACGDDRHAHQLQAPLLLLTDGKGQHDYRVDLSPRRQPVEEVVPVFDAVDVVQENVQVSGPQD